MKEFEIRNAVDEDSVTLSNLILENASHILKPHYNEEQWTAFSKHYSPEALSQTIKACTFFCACEGKEIIGCIGLDTNFVKGFYIRLKNRGQGIGRLLMNHLVKYARSIRINELRLAASPEGLRFYYKNGWRKIDDIIVNHFGVNFTETLMTRDISNKNS